MKKKLNMKKYLGKESEFVMNLGVMADFEGMTGHSFFKGFDMGRMKLDDMVKLILLGVIAAGYVVSEEEIRDIDIDLLPDFSEELGKYISSGKPISAGKESGGSPLAKKK